MTQVINIESPIERGDTVPWTIQWLDDQGAPLDMRGKTIVLTLKLSPFESDADALVTIEKEVSGVSLVNEVSMDIPKSESLNLIAGATHHYAVRVITSHSPENIEITHFKGTVPVEDA